MNHCLLSTPPGQFNIARCCLAAQAAAHPNKTGLIVAGDGNRQRRWSYGELDLMVRRLAGGLRALGLTMGERLMIRMDNDLEYILTFFAALASGLVPLPSSAALTGEEAEFLLADSGAAALALSDDLPLARALTRAFAAYGADRRARPIRRSRRLCRHRGRRSGFPHLHLWHGRQAEGGAAWPLHRLGTAADVQWLVRHYTGRCDPACGRVQLDLHARLRADRSLGERRHGGAVQRTG